MPWRVLAGHPEPLLGVGPTFVVLENQRHVTWMTYDTDMQVGGLIANMGQRMMNGADKLIIIQSLKKLQEE